MMMFNVIGESQAAIRDGRIHSTAEDRRLSWVHPWDVAAVAAVALTAPGNEGKTYDITGPESLSFDDLAERLGRVLGQHVTYERISDEEYRRRLNERGFTDYEVEHLVSRYRDALPTGYFDIVSDAVPALTDAAGTPFDEWVHENKELLSRGAAGS